MPALPYALFKPVERFPDKVMMVASNHSAFAMAEAMPGKTADENSKLLRGLERLQNAALINFRSLKNDLVFMQPTKFYALKTGGRS